MSIEVIGVSKLYGNQKALNNISFKVNKPEIVGFLGPNGAGKSTMMKILTTYIKATTGEAKVNGFDIYENQQNVQQSVGYLPEHNPLYLELFVKEYLKFNADIYKVSKKRIDDVIELTGLTSEAHKKIGQLSKGYRQRVGLANALLHDPVIIINKGEIVADKKLKDLRNEKEQTVIVEFDYRVEDVFLLKLPKVDRVVNTHDFVYEITFKTSEDMRSYVFDFAHDNQLKILQLNQKNASLESLFRELTS